MYHLNPNFRDQRVNVFLHFFTLGDTQQSDNNLALFKVFKAADM